MCKLLAVYENRTEDSPAGLPAACLGDGHDVALGHNIRPALRLPPHKHQHKCANISATSAWKMYAQEMLHCGRL
jgi:hypothetical protein